MTEINLHRAPKLNLFRINESKPIMFSDFSEYFLVLKFIVYSFKSISLKYDSNTLSGKI